MVHCTLKNFTFLSVLKSRAFTAIPYRANTGPEQGFPCVLFPHREKPVFITGFPGDENRDGFAVLTRVTKGQ